MKFLFFIFPLLSLMLVGCGSDEDPVPGDSLCGAVARVDEARWRDANLEGYVIEAAEIRGDCLEVTLAGSGCDGENWRVALIDAAAIAESLPPQRSIRIDFDNPEACLAYFRRSYSFDLKPLRTSSPSVFLHLDGWEGSLLYEYP